MYTCYTTHIMYTRIVHTTHNTIHTSHVHTDMFTHALDLQPNWEEGHFAYAQFLDEVCE